MCGLTKRHKAENQNLFANVIEYINANYSDSELSLTFIADKFGFRDISGVSKGIKNSLKNISLAKINFKIIYMPDLVLVLNH